MAERAFKDLPAPLPVEAGPSAPAVGDATPAMARYLEVKSAHPDFLLFYRMGDFYELFFEDAVKASAALGIALTKRGRHGGADIPMCGVPAHAAPSYLTKLIAAGFKVAICEQMEDAAEAKRRGGKSIIERKVTRLITAGTLTEETLLEPESHNYLCALAVMGSGADETLALAFADISTGDLWTQVTARAAIELDLGAMRPREIILADGDRSRLALGAEHGDGTKLTFQPSATFDSLTAERRLKSFFGVGSIDAFGSFSRAELSALGAIIAYLELTQRGRLPFLLPPRRALAGDAMTIDPQTRANLEILKSISGKGDYSLLGVVNRTRTNGGTRLLTQRLSAPLTSAAAINQRLCAVEFFKEQEGLLKRVQGALAGAPDMERALARLSLGRGGPRDLAAINSGIDLARGIFESVGSAMAENTLAASSELAIALSDLAPSPTLERLSARLTRALAGELPLLARDGGFIKRGFDPEIDRLRRLRDETRGVLAGLEQKYRQETELPGLRLKHNGVLGYYLEAGAAAGEKLLKAMPEGFIHRQTLAGTYRFSTTELGTLAADIESAGEAARALEVSHFEAFAAEATASGSDIHKAAKSLAVIDVTAGLAELALEQDYVRPFVDESRRFEIEEGRHPVVEASLRAAGNPKSFIANSCRLSDPDEARLWLLTGPNMAGKSTFLRQNALIAILGQAGSYVPAGKAHIGVIDRIFSRVGASDDLAQGRSTFMVEMVETAAILHQSTDRSFIILDEIGRGTATFDGLAIAWATLEYLHDKIKARALFATHYHELTGLAARLAALKCMTMKVKEYKGEIRFLHEIAPGAADGSYGVQVARLAGMPRLIVERAGEILKELEAGEAKARIRSLVEDLPLFAAMMKETVPVGAEGDPRPWRAILDRLDHLNPDEMSPRDALAALYELKRLRREEERP